MEMDLVLFHVAVRRNGIIGTGQRCGMNWILIWCLEQKWSAHVMCNSGTVDADADEGEEEEDKQNV